MCNRLSIIVVSVLLDGLLLNGCDSQVSRFKEKVAELQSRPLSLPLDSMRYIQCQDVRKLSENWSIHLVTAIILSIKEIVMSCFMLRKKVGNRWANRSRMPIRWCTRCLVASCYISVTIHVVLMTVSLRCRMGGKNYGNIGNKWGRWGKEMICRTNEKE